MDKMREEFEAWAKTRSLKNFLFWHPSDGQYEVHAVQMAFEGWQASRSALCVELPDAWNLAEHEYKRQVEESLGSAGVSYD